VLTRLGHFLTAHAFDVAIDVGPDNASHQVVQIDRRAVARSDQPVVMLA